MWPLVIIEAHVSIYSRSGFTHALVGPKIHLLVLEGPSQPLDKDVVRVLPLAIHTDLDASLQQQVRKGVAGELTPLIGVEDLRSGFAQGLSLVYDSVSS